MRIRPAVLAATLLCLASVQAGAEMKITPIEATAVQSEVSGVVAVVNTDTRTLTIRRADGVFEVLHAPPEAKRLDQIRIGDKLTVTKLIMTMIELEQGRNAGSVGKTAQTDVQRDSGSRFGGSITDSLIEYGRIVGVDRAAGTVTIKDSDSTDIHKVEDKSLLTTLNVKKGDGVVVTTRTEVVGVIGR